MQEWLGSDNIIVRKYQKID